jgi:HEAT repeat protein
VAHHLPGPAEHWVSTLILGEEDRLMAADYGFSLLGAQAAPAVPELIRLSSEETRVVAHMILLDIGQAAIPDLTAALTNRANPYRVRVCAAEELGSVGVDSSVATVLASCLQDEPQVAEEAAASLGRFHDEPAIAVPALMKAAQNGPNSVREQAIWALAEFNTNALPAVPVLTNFLADPDQRIRGAAGTVLQDIAPEVLETNAGAVEKTE